MPQIFAHKFHPRVKQSKKSIRFTPGWNSCVTPFFSNAGWKKFYTGAKFSRISVLLEYRHNEHRHTWNFAPG